MKRDNNLELKLDQLIKAINKLVDVLWSGDDEELTPDDLLKVYKINRLDMEQVARLYKKSTNNN